MATIALSGNAIIKAGAGVGAVPPAAWDGYIEQAEALCAAVSRYDWVTNWGTVSGSSVAPLLTQICEDLAAIYGITYNMSGTTYTSRVEAEDMVNVLRDAALRGLSLLRDQKVIDFTT